MKNGIGLLFIGLERIVTALVALLVLVVLWGVLSRFVVSVPSRWTEELATCLLSWVALLGAAVAMRRHQHPGVDFFFSRLHPDTQRLNAMIVQLLIIVFASTVMIWGGVSLVARTLSTGQVTAALGIRTGLVYLAVPISGLAMLLSGIEELAILQEEMASKGDAATSAPDRQS